MNVRFAAPGGAAGLYEPGSEPALWWGTYKDAERRRSAASLLDRCTRTRTCPKVIEAFGAAEFWGLRMSPGLVGTDAKHDIALPDNVRRYYMPGTTHGGGPGGFQIAQAANERCSLPQNPNPMADTHRALIAALIEWVVKGTAPPPSRYPTLADGQLAPAATVAAAFPKIPGLAVPEVNHVLDYDFGDDFDYRDISGVITRLPPSDPESGADAGAPRQRGRQRDRRRGFAAPSGAARHLSRVERHRVGILQRTDLRIRGRLRAICGDARRAREVRRSAPLGRGALRHAGRLRLRGDARGERARARPFPAARGCRPPDRQRGQEPSPAVELPRAARKRGALRIRCADDRAVARSAAARLQGHRLHPRARRSAVHDAARGHGRGSDQDRGSAPRRRHARLGPLRRRLEHLLPDRQPQQEERGAST